MTEERAKNETIAPHLAAVPKPYDPVCNPSHYSHLDPQPKDVLVRWSNQGVPHYVCSAVEYGVRAGHKDDEEQDLLKAIQNLKIQLAFVRARKGKTTNEDGT